MFRFAVGRLALVVRAAIAIQTSAAGGPPPVVVPARFTPGFWRGRGRAGCLSIRVQRWAGETKRPLPAKRLPAPNDHRNQGALAVSRKTAARDVATAGGRSRCVGHRTTGGEDSRVTAPPPRLRATSPHGRASRHTRIFVICPTLSSDGSWPSASYCYWRRVAPMRQRRDRLSVSSKRPTNRPNKSRLRGVSES